MKKVLFSATVDSHILHFHLPYLKWFKENGYEVHVATNGDQEIPYCDKKIKISFERSPFKLNNLKAIKQLMKVIMEEKYDIIHTHTPMGSVVTRLAAKKARKKYGVRVIYTAHGLHFYKGAPLKNWLLFYPVEKYLSRYTDTIILINKEDYDLAKRKFKSKNIEYVPGVGIDEEKFNFKMTKKEKHDLRESLGLKDDDFVMIYPAELNGNKNQLLLINVMETLAKEYSYIKLLLPGIDSCSGYYQRLVKEKKLDNNIKFLGFRTDIPKLLKISDLAVSSSKREGLPVNIMEAMCVGLPIVASDCRGNRDLIHDDKNGYIVSLNNVNGFHDAIVDVLNKSTKVDYISNSKEIIRPYTLKNVFENMKKIYNRGKSIIFLRSTSIINDSRATKEIEAYSSIFNRVIALGWNRQNLVLNNNYSNIDIYLYNKSSEYGKGIKNIFKMLLFRHWLYINLKKNKSQYDIIHACDFDTAHIAYKIAKKYKKKLIYDIYDYYVDCHKLSFLKCFIEQKDISIINDADYVIICTEQRITQIAKASPKKISVIHNTPQINFKSSKNSLNKKKKICYVGILQDDRLLIEIAEKIKDNNNYELHIGGFGKYEAYFKNLSETVKNVKFYGQLNYLDVLKLEDQCDILFATYNPKIENHKYSAPNKVYEAMALSKPIIVCNNTGVDQLVNEEKIGYSIDYNAEEFIKCLDSIDENEYEKISKRTRKLYLEKYNWDIMKERLIDICKELEEGD